MKHDSDKEFNKFIKLDDNPAPKMTKQVESFKLENLNIDY